MKISGISHSELRSRLKGDGLFFRTGPFTVCARTILPDVIESIQNLYADYPLADSDGFADFHISLASPANLRRWVRPQVQFLFDGWMPFKPMPRDQAIPVMEWGLNWSISSHANQYLIIHAAAIEKGGFAVIMPAPPASGKSTLCAGLVSRGWRLLSDELVLLSLDGSSITPLARPINLKNQSIGVIREFSSKATFSRETKDTIKGTVALLKAPTDSVARIEEMAKPGWIIFPKFQKGVEADLRPRSKAETFLEIGTNAFNYSTQGATGFEALGNVVDACNCFDFTYSSLDDAIQIFSALEPPSGPAHNSRSH